MELVNGMVTNWDPTTICSLFPPPPFFIIMPSLPPRLSRGIQRAIHSLMCLCWMCHFQRVPKLHREWNFDRICLFFFPLFRQSSAQPLIWCRVCALFVTLWRCCFLCLALCVCLRIGLNGATPTPQSMQRHCHTTAGKEWKAAIGKWNGSKWGEIASVVCESELGFTATYAASGKADHHTVLQRREPSWFCFNR